MEKKSNRVKRDERLVTKAYDKIFSNLSDPDEIERKVHKANRISRAEDIKNTAGI